MGFLDLVDLWQILEIKRKIEMEIVCHLIPNACLGCLLYATMYQLRDLKQKAEQMIQADLFQVSNIEDCISLNFSELTDLITDQKLQKLHFRSFISEASFQKLHFHPCQK